MNSRRIVANLDHEQHLTAAIGAARPLRKEARRSVATLGTLLRVFAGEGDRLWIDGRVSPRRIPPVEGIPSPKFEGGELRRLPPAAAWLGWAESEEIAALRARDRVGELRVSEPDLSSVAAAPWGLPAPVAQVAKRFHDRRTHLALSEELGLALPGARWISDLDDLDQHLAAGAASTAPEERWILKPAFSAAGRSWVRGQGPRIEGAARTRVESLLETSPGLLFEPRLEVVRDVAFLVAVTESGPKIVGRHLVENTAAGRFRAIRIGARPPAREEFSRFDARAESAVLRVVGRLHEQGFRGICGIDAWLGCTAAGDLHPRFLGEINARLTFGWVAHAWRERLIATDAIPAGAPCALRTSPDQKAPAHAIPLLLAGEHDSMCAWFEAETPAADDEDSDA